MSDKTLTPQNDRNTLDAEEVYEIRRHAGNAVAVNRYVESALFRGEFATPNTVPQREEIVQDIRELMAAGDYNGAAQALEDYRGPWLENTTSRDRLVDMLRGGAVSWGIVSSTLANDGASSDLITDYHRDALAASSREDTIETLSQATGTTERDAAIVNAADEARRTMNAHGGVLSMDEISYDDTNNGVHASVAADKALGGRG
jgi:hypothetical protein